MGEWGSERSESTSLLCGTSFASLCDAQGAWGGEFLPVQNSANRVASLRCDWRRDRRTKGGGVKT